MDGGGLSEVICGGQVVVSALVKALNLILEVLSVGGGRRERMSIDET